MVLIFGQEKEEAFFCPYLSSKGKYSQKIRQKVNKIFYTKPLLKSNIVKIIVFR